MLTPCLWFVVPLCHHISFCCCNEVIPANALLMCEYLASCSMLNLFTACFLIQLPGDAQPCQVHGEVRLGQWQDEGAMGCLLLPCLAANPQSDRCVSDSRHNHHHRMPDQRLMTLHGFQVRETKSRSRQCMRLIRNNTLRGTTRPTKWATKGDISH